MSEIAFGCNLVYEVTAPTTFLLSFGVAQRDSQLLVHEYFQLTPNVLFESLELGPERNRVHRINLQPCQFSLHYAGVVDLSAEIHPMSGLVETPYGQLPPEVILYLNPSRYCESDLLANYAMTEFGSLCPGYARVRAICDWTHHQLVYTIGSSDSQTTAADVLVQRRGVCRDFAHLAIALCRGLNIPARYVSGYAVDLQPRDFHGFFEAYLGDRWYLFDATRLVPVGGLVRIASGRDAADVPFATLMGSATLLSKNVWAQNNSAQMIEPAS